MSELRQDARDRNGRHRSERGRGRGAGGRAGATRRAGEGVRDLWARGRDVARLAGGREETPKIFSERRRKSSGEISCEAGKRWREIDRTKDRRVDRLMDRCRQIEDKQGGKQTDRFR